MTDLRNLGNEKREEEKRNTDIITLINVANILKRGVKNNLHSDLQLFYIYQKCSHGVEMKSRFIRLLTQYFLISPTL